MAVPSCFDTDFLRVALAGITDVQTILDELNDNLTVDLPVASRWTALGGGVYRSPIQDPGGANRFMTITATRASATRITWVVRDQNGNVVMDGCFDISGTATCVIWTGPYHACVEVLYGGSTTEGGYAFMTDPSPFGMGSAPTYVVGRTRRNSAGTLFGTQTMATWAMNDQSGASSMTARMMGFTVNSASVAMRGDTTAGSVAVLAAEVAYSFSASVRRWSGRGYQVIVVPDFLTAYTEVQVPLDSGVIGVFEVLALAGVTTSIFNASIAVRKA